MTTLTQAPPLPESPYRGIEPFRFIDQSIFSAREDETWNLLSNILIYRGVLLYGDSGSGKSSLINAGLIPAALEQGLIANRLRIQPRAGKEFKLERISVESEDGPPYLASVFVDDKSGPLSIELSLEDFSGRLVKLKEASSDETRPLVIFDQFEEFITLFEQTLRGGATPEAKKAQKHAPEVQRAILQTIARLMDDERLPVKFLFVFREDYLAKLDPLFETRPELLDQYVRLLPPRVEEAEKIIRAPFENEAARRNFSTQPTVTSHEISPSLAQAVAAQLQERSESGFINLSELQIVCRKLSQAPEPDAFFQKLGAEVQRVLEDYWADVLSTLGDLYDPAIALLGHMITSSNTRNIVSEPDLQNDEKENFTLDQIEKALEALVQHKLIRREPRYKIYFYEIASEFLVPWIQQKKAARLAEIEARKLAAESERKLALAEKQKRSLWIGSSFLVLLLVAAIGSAVFAFYLRKVADDALRSAEAAKAELTEQKDWSGSLVSQLNKLTQQDSQARLDAINNLIAMDQQKQLPHELVPVIVAVTSQEPDKRVATTARYFFEVAARESKSGITTSILKTAENNTTLASSPQVTPRIYIEISSNSQRPRAEKIAAAMRAMNFIVPGFQLVDSNHAPSSNQLRYPPAGPNPPSDAIDPKQILSTIIRVDGQKWSAVPLPKTGAGRPGHLEIWFQNDAPANQQVTLTLNFTDEAGRAITVATPTVTLEPSPFTGKQFLSKSSQISAPAGQYILFVQAPNYQLFRDEITLQGNEVKETIMLHATKLPNQQKQQKGRAKD